MISIFDKFFSMFPFFVRKAEKRFEAQMKFIDEFLPVDRGIWKLISQYDGAVGNDRRMILNTAIEEINKVRDFLVKKWSFPLSLSQEIEKLPRLYEGAFEGSQLDMAGSRIRIREIVKKLDAFARRATSPL